MCSKKSGIKSPGLWDLPNPGKWLSFEKARKIARTFGLEYKEEWDMLIHGKLNNTLPAKVPPNPDEIYKHVGWRGWSDWLMDKKDRKQYSSFRESRDFVRCLRSKSESDWQDCINKAKPVHEKYGLTIPVKPDLEYCSKGWKGWEDWLGTGIAFKDFKTTRKFIRSLKLKSYNEWINYCKGLLYKYKKPENIYAFPDIAYKSEGWISWDDWLGIDLFANEKKKVQTYLPENAFECRCKGQIPDCLVCDGKGYYFKP
jgi:hypothetical protein